MPLDVVVVGPDGKKARVGEGQKVELAAPAPVFFADSPNIDAFGRLRVSNPQTIFDSQLQYNLAPIQWETVTTAGGSAAHLPNESAARLRVDTTSNASCLRQTYQYHRYQPSKSQNILMTFVLGAANANVDKRLGYFDDENGIYLTQNGVGAVAIGLRSYVTGSVVNTEIAQGAWNLDAMDGSGPSGVALDWTKSQQLVIDLEWLSVGRVRVGFRLAGLVVYAHEFLIANTISTGYMTTANLPLRYEIVATGAAGGTTDLIQICCAITSEGGFEIGRGLPFTYRTASAGVSVTTTEKAVLAIRPRGTFNSIVNRALVIVEHFRIYVTGQDIYWSLLYDPTLTSSWADMYTAASTIEVGTPSAFSDGFQIDSGFLKAAQQTANTLDSLVAMRNPITLDKAGANPIAVALTAASLTGTAVVRASISWRELY